MSKSATNSEEREHGQVIYVPIKRLWAPLPALHETKLQKLVDYAKESYAKERGDIQILSRGNQPLQKMLLNLAAAAISCMEQEAVPLDEKIRRVTGYTRARLDSINEQLSSLSQEVEKLNCCILPGPTNPIALLAKFGWSGMRSLYGNRVPRSLSDEDIHDFRKLPHILEVYRAYLKDWPHPHFRKKFSDRNWKMQGLAALCAFVQAIHQDKTHYDEVASILTVAARFLRVNTANGKINAESVRKDLRNFKKRNPEVWELYQENSQMEACRPDYELGDRK